MGIESLVSAMSANYDEAKNTAKSFSGEKVPEGKYEMKLFPIKFNEKEKDGVVKVSLQRSFTVLSGENQGMTQMDFMQLGHKVGLSFAMRFISVMGYEIPDSPAEWPEIIESINSEEPLVIAEVVHSGDFVNVRVLELLEDDENENEPETEVEIEDDEIEDDETEDETEDGNSDGDDDSDEDETEETGPSIPELKQIIKDEGLKIRVPKGMTAEELLSVIEKKRGKKSEKVKTTVADLITWADGHGIEDLNPKASLEETVAELLEYELEEDEVSEDDLAFMKDNGLAGMYPTAE